MFILLVILASLEITNNLFARFELPYTQDSNSYFIKNGPEESVLTITQDFIWDLKNQVVSLTNLDKVIIEKEANLTFQNGQIKIYKDFKFCTSSTLSKIIFKDVTIILQDQNTSFSEGSFEISGNVIFCGKENLESKLTLATDGTLLVKENSIFKLGQNTSLVYSAPLKTNLDEAEQSKQKEKIILEKNAVLILDRAKIISTNYGLAFKSGSIFIQGECSFEFETNKELTLKLQGWELSSKGLQIFWTNPSYLKVNAPIYIAK